jgi:hypothetical protein
MLYDTYCPKLTAAYGLLIQLLMSGAVPISICISRARACGISQRTLYAARGQLPIKALRLPGQVGQAHWQLIDAAGDQPPAPRPISWRPPAPPRPCAGCGEPMLGAHWMRKRCRPCKRAVAAARAMAGKQLAHERTSEMPKLERRTGAWSE